MKTSDYILLITGMGLVTYLPRWFPLIYLSKRRLPEWFSDFLDLIPAAILSALLAPMIFAGGSGGSLDVLHPNFLVAVPTFLFAVKTRSLGGTVVFGMMLYWLCDIIF